jgi:hypothetical protein
MSYRRLLTACTAVLALVAGCGQPVGKSLVSTGDGQHPQPTDSAHPIESLSAHAANVALLRQILHGSDWNLVYTRTGSEIEPGALELVPGSAATKGLPASMAATVEIAVARAAADVTCPGDPAYAPTGSLSLVSCRTENPARGGTLIISRATNSVEEVYDLTTVRYLRPDRTSVSVELVVTGGSFHQKADHQAALAWLPKFDQELITAATDPGLRTEQPGTIDPLLPQLGLGIVSQNALADMDLTRRHLGADSGWALIHDEPPNARGREGPIPPHESFGLGALPGTAAAAGLPAGFTLTAGASLAREPARCYPLTGAKAMVLDCRLQTAPDGDTVVVNRTHQPFRNSAGGYRSIEVAVNRPDGTAGSASLVAQSSRADVTAERLDQVMAWLDAHLDQLIEIAQDPRILDVQPRAQT